MELLRLEHIQKYYGHEGGLTQAIRDISFYGGSRGVCWHYGGVRFGQNHSAQLHFLIDTRQRWPYPGFKDQDITELEPRQLSRFRRENLGFIFQDFQPAGHP